MLPNMTFQDASGDKSSGTDLALIRFLARVRSYVTDYAVSVLETPATIITYVWTIVRVNLHMVLEGKIEVNSHAQYFSVKLPSL